MWAELPTAGDRTRPVAEIAVAIRRQFRHAGTYQVRENPVTKQCPVSGGAVRWGEWLSLGAPAVAKGTPFCNAARASFDSRNRIEFQELNAASYCGVWNKNIGSGCAVLPYRMILPVPGSGRLVLFEAYPTRDVIHREIWGREVFLFDAGNRPVWQIAPEQARRTTCTGISMRPAPPPTPSPPSAISTNDFTRAGSAVTPL